MTRRVRGIASLLSLIGLVGMLLSVAAAPALAAGTTIDVTSAVDSAVEDGVCTLREAIIAANTDTASGATAGECPAGSATEPDAITFSVNGPIVLGSLLPSIAGDVDIDGLHVDNSTTGLDGNALFGQGVLTVASGTVTISNLGVEHGGDRGVENHGTLTLDSVVIDDNDGGGVRSDGDLTIRNSEIAFNHASSAAGITAAGRLRVVDTRISGNTTDGFIGTVYFQGDDGLIDRTEISGNHADVAGGGIEVGTEGLIVSNSTIADNTTNQAGGGIQLEGGVTITLINVTVTGNSVAGGQGGNDAGGGLNGGAGATLINTIIAGNSAPNDPDVEGTPASTTASLIGVPVGKTLADIFIPGLAGYGGPTQTMALVPGAANPAVDTANDAACAGAPVSGIDQRGVARPIGAHCDIGAFEADAPAPTLPPGPTPTRLIPTQSNTSLADPASPSGPTRDAALLAVLGFAGLLVLLIVPIRGRRARR